MKIDVDFEKINCCECGLVFAVMKTIKGKWLRTHEFFSCPSCRTQQHFEGESELEKMTRLFKCEQTRSQGFSNEANHAQHQINGYKGVIAKMKKAVKM